MLILCHSNWRPAVAGVLDPDSSPLAFHRAGGRSRSLDGRHSRYSYVIVGALMGFGDEVVGLKPTQS
jgi:hypothetical protein